VRNSGADGSLQRSQRASLSSTARRSLLPDSQARLPQACLRAWMASAVLQAGDGCF